LIVIPGQLAQAMDLRKRLRAKVAAVAGIIGLKASP